MIKEDVNRRFSKFDSFVLGIIIKKNTFFSSEENDKNNKFEINKVEENTQNFNKTLDNSTSLRKCQPVFLKS